MIARAPLSLLVLSLVATSAFGQATSSLKNHDNNAPIDFDADSIEVQDRADRAVLTGNVHVRQAEMTMEAARVVVAYTDNGQSTDVQRLDASGGVTLRSPTETARGAFAIYDVPGRLITMIGGVTLQKGSNQVKGGRLVVNLVTGRATIDGSAVGGGNINSSGGRVSGRFTVPKRAGQPTGSVTPPGKISATPPK
ncbi:LptA/OstA family protein [Sphingomonas sp. ID0503]|uniref:LptA/OstA family protein n=1 Tax=Sphingomonas sp. ID0503 TaxID=3399691 RepID=UPI003AFADE60